MLIAGGSDEVISYVMKIYFMEDSNEIKETTLQNIPNSTKYGGMCEALCEGRLVFCGGFRSKAMMELDM